MIQKSVSCKKEDTYLDSNLQKPNKSALITLPSARRPLLMWTPVWKKDIIREFKMIRSKFRRY